MDPNTYPNPAKYNPDRFLGKQTGTDSNGRDQLIKTNNVPR